MTIELREGEKAQKFSYTKKIIFLHSLFACDVKNLHKRHVKIFFAFFALLVVFAIFFHRKANYYDELYVQTLSQTFKDSYKKFFWTAVVFDFLIGILFCGK